MRMGKVLTRTRAAVAATVGSLLLLPACSHAAPPTNVPAPVTMAYCGSGPQVRPTVLEIVCGTSEIAAGSLTWAAWGKPIATGVGTAVVDMCTYEDCHTGSYISAPIVVIASKIVRCTRDTQAYSRLQYVFVGGSPLPAVPAGAKYSNYIAAPDRSVPPADQTIGLTC
jgi:hypothetical protein